MRQLINDFHLSEYLINDLVKCCRKGNCVTCPLRADDECTLGTLFALIRKKHSELSAKKPECISEFGASIQLALFKNDLLTKQLKNEKKKERIPESPES